MTSSHYGLVYPRLVSFDEWDGLYYVNDFLATPKNDIDHTVGVSLLGLPNEGSVTVELWVDGEETPRASVDTTTGDKVEMGVKVDESGSTPLYGYPVDVTFEASFLKQDDDACLPVDGSFKVVATQGDTSWSWPLALTVSQGVVDEPAGKEGQELCPINTLTGGTTGVGVKWPDSVPIIGGGDLKFWAPQLPIDIYANPFGLVQITLKFTGWGYKGNTDSPENAKWGKFPRKSVADQWETKTKALKCMTDKTSALVSEPGAIQQIDLFKSISGTVNFQLLALAQWKPADGLFQGEVAGQILGAFNFTITESFFAGPIPVLITFSLDMSAIFGISAAAYSAKKDKDESLIDAIFDFSRWQWDYQNTGLSLTFSITPALSVGVGIRGVASISIKGAITFTAYVGVPFGTQPEGLPAVHRTAGWSAQISLVVELFLFTKSFALYNKKFENFYDNWKSSSSLAAEAEDEAANAMANLSLGQLLDGLKPITDDMLALTSEASEDSSMNAQADASTQCKFVNWNDLAHEEVVDLGDGTSMSVVVYDLGSTQPKAEAEEPAAAAEDKPTEGQSGAEGQPGADAATVEGAQPDADATTAGGDAPDATTGDTASATSAAAAPDATAGTNEGDSSTVTAGDSVEKGPGVLASAAAVTASAVAGEGLGAQSEGAQVQAGDNTALQASAGSDATSPAAAGDTTPQAATGDTTPQPIAEGGALDAQSQDAAAEDAAMEAQADNVALPVASWLQAASNGPLPELGIASLGAQGGVRPSSDVRLFGSDDKHVLSAAHVHVLDIGEPIGKTQEHGVWCFRIGAVRVDGQARTRIMANCIDGDPKGSSKVIEFDTNLDGMPHTDLYDYDYDVMARQEDVNGKSRSAVCFVILSGKRDNGGNVALASASTDLVITYLWLDSQDFVGDTEVLKPGDVGRFSMRASGIANIESSKPHCISNLMIANCPKENSGYDLLAIMFLDRYADAADEVLGDTAHVCIGALMVRRMADAGGAYRYTMEKYSADWWHNSVGDIDPTVYEAEVVPTSYVGDPLLGIPWFLMLRGANNVHYIRTVLSNYNPQGKYVFKKPVRCGDFDPSIRMVWCSAIGGFLTSYPADPAQLELKASEKDYSNWSLYKATWSNDKTPKLQVEPIGPSGFNVVNFAVRDGFLFWPNTCDADEDRVWDADGNEDVKEREPVYQIMSSRLRGDHFSDPFVVADLSNDTDMLSMLSVISVNGTAIMEALRTVYVDTGERGDSDMPLYHAADIWYTAVPAVRCAMATACEAENPFVSPGGNIDFRVAVRNDGNTFLSGCTLKLCAYNDDTQAYDYVSGAESTIAFSADTICESNYNQSDGQGGYTNVEPDYALAPGKTSVYAVTVTVPSDWPSGDKKVLFVATDGQIAPEDSFSAQADGEPEAVEFHVEPGTYKVVQQRTSAEQDADQRHMDTLTVTPNVAGGMRFRSASTTQTSKGGGGANVGSGNGGNNGGSGSSNGGNTNGNNSGKTTSGNNTTTRNVTPKTGDSTPSAGFGLAGAALTAVGAALAAYERRRAENEDL